MLAVGGILSAISVVFTILMVFTCGPNVILFMIAMWMTIRAGRMLVPVLRRDIDLDAKVAASVGTLLVGAFLLSPDVAVNAALGGAKVALSSEWWAVLMGPLIGLTLEQA